LGQFLEYRDLAVATTRALCFELGALQARALGSAACSSRNAG
jgi:hypothetical protein